MSTTWYQAQMMLPALRRLADAVPDGDDGDSTKGAPDEVVDWLTDLRLLRGVPFAYLVPDASMLPPESIRFFWLDRDWTDAAVEGALSAAGAFSSVRTQAQQVHAATRHVLDGHERVTSPHRVEALPGVVRRTRGGTYTRADGVAGERRYDTLSGGPEVITGFLLRSRAVAGWPGMHVRANRARKELTLLRVERLAPAVLLVLIDGVPDEVALEEPKRGLQFGVDPATDHLPDGTENPDEHPKGHRTVLPRNPDTGEELTDEPTIGVPFRPGSTGVVDMRGLAAAVQDAGLEGVGTDGGDVVSTAELTTQLLQFPYRQWFRGDGRAEDGGEHVSVVLRVTTPLEVLGHLAHIDG